MSTGGVTRCLRVLTREIWKGLCFGYDKLILLKTLCYVSKLISHGFYFPDGQILSNSL